MNRFKELRELQGLKQIDVCPILNVTQGLVSQWETGKSSPRIELLPKLADLYNCTIDELLNYQTTVS